MKSPNLEIIPLKPAVRRDVPVTLDVLVRLTPPLPEGTLVRPALNLGFVLDRSGSMGERNKIQFAREAAIYAVQQLLPTDRVSVTVFDNEVVTIVPNSPAEEKGRIVDLIRRVMPRGSTALHDGWQEGARQVGGNLLTQGLNRVLLLSDGLANAGKTAPDAIAGDVHRLALEKVSTTTLGLGDDYNEDLLQAMAQSGDGNYYYIEHPRQLPDIFQTELRGLMASFGTAVSLGVQTCEGVQLAEVLNDLDKLPTGELKLPNLVAGMPINVLLRFNVAPGHGERELVRFHLRWHAPEKGQQEELWASLRLPAVDAGAWQTLAPVLEVQLRASLFLIARYKEEANRLAQHGEIEKALKMLGDAKKLLEELPDSPERRDEAEALALLEADLVEGQLGKFAKRAKHQAYQRRSSKPY